MSVPPPPERLYTPADLYHEWEPDDPASAARTFDFRTYEAARRAGARIPATREIAAARAEHDTAVSWALDAALDGTTPVAIMGGHDLARNDTRYADVARLAERLAMSGFTVLTGGGPGAMEAAHLGARCATTSMPLGTALDRIGAARKADDEDGTSAFPFRSATELFGAGGELEASAVARLHRWQAPAFALAAATAEDAGSSIGIPTWLHGHEPPTPLASQHAKYFDNSIREDGLLGVATAGVVFAPGGAGTLQEIFQDAAQNYYMTVEDRFSPMVFWDVDEYWSVEYNVRAVLERLFDDAQERKVAWADTIDEVVDVLLAANAEAP